MSYTNKTQATTITPQTYLEKNFKDAQIQADAQKLIDLYTEVTGSHCVMWDKIFGFGTYYYQDSKGGEHSWSATGFAISKTGFTLYNMMGWENYQNDIQNLGKFKLSGQSCLAVKSLSDIDQKLLKTVIKKSLSNMKEKYRVEH